jgi:hypothetical protein
MNYSNPLTKSPRPLTNNDKVAILVGSSGSSEKIIPHKSYVYWLSLIVVLGIFLFLIPLLELAVGAKYIDTTSCVSHGINGTQALFSKGFFGIIYLLLFLIHWCKRPVDFTQSFWKLIKSFHFVFIGITVLYAGIHFILMVLEFVFLRSCTDYVRNVSGMLWVSALNSLFALFYVIYATLKLILC